MSIEELEALREKEIHERFQTWLLDAPAYAPSDYDKIFQSFKAGYILNEPPSGNQYTGYLKEGNVTLEKVRKDEPIFILRAQDNTAPGIVLSWIGKNLDTVDEAKLKEAFQTVLAMRRYHSRRDPT